MKNTVLSSRFSNLSNRDAAIKLLKSITADLSVSVTSQNQRLRQSTLLCAI